MTLGGNKAPEAFQPLSPSIQPSRKCSAAFKIFIMLSAAEAHLTLDHLSPKLQVCLFVFRFCLRIEWKAVISGSHPQGMEVIPTVAMILCFSALRPNQHSHIQPLL